MAAPHPIRMMDRDRLGLLTAVDDDVILDPDVPESLVYDTSDGGRRLVAAMYMLQRGTPLEQAPDLGGNLMQWHTHGD